MGALLDMLPAHPVKLIDWVRKGQIKYDTRNSRPTAKFMPKGTYMSEEDADELITLRRNCLVTILKDGTVVPTEKSCQDISPPLLKLLFYDNEHYSYMCVDKPIRREVWLACAVCDGFFNDRHSIHAVLGGFYGTNPDNYRMGYARKDYVGLYYENPNIRHDYKITKHGKQWPEAEFLFVYALNKTVRPYAKVKGHGNKIAPVGNAYPVVSWLSNHLALSRDNLEI